MLNRKSLQIALWNAQSILPKITEFTKFLNSQNIDICLISETWLKVDEGCSVQNYSIYRRDRPSVNIKRNSGGGVAIAIRNDIPHNQLPGLDLQVVESIGIEVCSIQIYSIYFSGSKLTPQKLRSFNQDIIKIASMRNKFLVGGDLNSKHRLWNCIKGNSAGKILFQEMRKRNFIVHFPDSPTYFPPQANRTNPSTIDLFLSNGLNDILNTKTVNDLSSDHLPVTFQLELFNTFKSVIPQNKCYHRADWSKFKSYLNENIDLLTVTSRLNTKEDIDVSVEELVNLIKKAEALSVPLIKNTYRSSPFSDSILKMITLRNYKRRLWQRNKQQDIKSDINFLNRQIKAQIKSFNNEIWNTKLSQLKKHSNQFWKVTKTLKNPINKIPPLKSPTSLLLTDQDKANGIGSAFCAAHSTTFNDLSDASTESVVLMSYNNISYFQPTIKESYLPTPREISRLIRGLKNKKSPGDDAINNIILKRLPKKAIILLMHIYRACFKLSYFPEGWKCAKVIPIPKPKKDLTLASNYRPISLLNSLSKVLEKLILTRLKAHISARNILPNEQFGFRPAHSTNHQLLRVCQFIKASLQKKHSTGMITFDIEKAFDSVWHKGLLHKMSLLKFPLYLTKIIQSFLMKRSYYVSINGHKSNSFRILAGVPQGSVLSPTLYNIFTSDLKITHSEKAFFADDSCLYVAAKSPRKIVKKLNAAGKQLTEYAEKWKIKLNESKTNAAFFTRKTSTKWLPSEGITIRDTEIHWTNSVKYLGLTLDKTMTFKSNTDLISDKALKFLGMLYPLLNRKSRLNTTNKLLIYRAIIQSILLGACPVWGNCAKSHIEKLQVIQNKCLKIILNLPRTFNTNELHKCAAVPQISQQISKINLKLRSKLLRSDNLLIRNLY